MIVLIILGSTLIGFGLFGISFELWARHCERKRDSAIIPWQHGRTPSFLPYAPHGSTKTHHLTDRGTGHVSLVERRKG